jgi:hypothetical protein
MAQGINYPMVGMLTCKVQAIQYPGQVHDGTSQACSTGGPHEAHMQDFCLFKHLNSRDPT